jgi:hypothetical protein
MVLPGVALRERGAANGLAALCWGVRAGTQNEVPPFRARPQLFRSTLGLIRVLGY